MRKLSFIIVAGVLCITATYVGVSAMQTTQESILFIHNLEALTQSNESTGDGLAECPSKVTPAGDVIVVTNAKNRWLGLVAGCKYDCGFTCTVKNINWPGI